MVQLFAGAEQFKRGELKPNRETTDSCLKDYPLRKQAEVKYCL